MKLKIVVFSVLAISLFSCKTQFNANRPKETYIAPKVEKTLSTIGLSIDLDIPSLEKSLNNSLKGLIYEDNNLADDNLLIKIWKTQDFHFSVVGNKINYTVPLKIWVKTGYKKEVFGINLEQYAEANGAINVNLSSTFNLEKEWKITTSTSLLNYNWIEKPNVNVAGYNLPITHIADIALKAFKNKISHSIDKAIAEKSDIKKTMTDTWSKIQDPIVVNNDYNVSITIEPIEIYSTPIVGNGNKLHFNLGMNTFIETTVGPTPNQNSIKTTLPNYKTVNKLTPNFTISTNVQISHQKITEIASKELVGKEFSEGKKKIIINSLNIFGGENGLLVVETKVSGSANGTIYCVGKLAFDNQTKLLSITDFDFDVSTRNALIKSANWLLHKNFLKTIEPKLRISLTNEITNMLTSSNNLLKNYQIQKGIFLKGQVNNVIFDTITINKDVLIVSGKMNGNLHIKLSDLF
ncbi:MAG: DUF4403 family protein [Paludibacteraceae bacterium]|nr:DUF4403 family protein [Paludibacteraceae bacterium]